MRRSITTVATIAAGLVAAFGSGACEDGPSQTFTPAPTGAANVWNGSPAGQLVGDAGLFVPNAAQTYDSGTQTGQNANDLCTAAQEKTIWTNMFTMPMIPNPGLGAGLDLAGGPNPKYPGVAGYDPTCNSYKDPCPPLGGPNTAFTYNPATVVEPWTGVTLTQAEQLLCQALQPNSPFGASSAQGWAGWGESDEVNVFYNDNNLQLTDLFFFPGYVGNMTGTCTPPPSPTDPGIGTKYAKAGAVGGCTVPTTYTISMYNNVYMTKQVQGQPPENIELSWSTNPNTSLVSNEIYEALRETFAPTIPADVDCVAAGHCIIDNNGTSDGILFFTPLNMAIFIASTVATTPAGTSIPIFIDVGVAKILPFSPAEVTLKLDNIGPTVYGSPSVLGLTNSQTACNYQLGIPYGSPTMAGTFEADCVQPYANEANGAVLNQVAQAKLIGAIAHADETYAFDIEGVDPQFAATSLPPNEVIADGQLPGPNDTAYSLNIDQFVLGPIANDYTDNDSTKPKDWHGIGIVTLETAWQIHKYMAANYGVNTDLGDPYCVSAVSGLTTSFGAAPPLRPGAQGAVVDAGVDAGDGGADAGPVGPASCSNDKPCCTGASCNLSCTAPAGAASPGWCAPGQTGCTCQPKVCSGLEAITTTAPPSLIPADHPQWAVNMIGAAGTTVNNASGPTGTTPVSPCSAAQLSAQPPDTNCVANGLAVGLKPGTWYALLCEDAGGLDGAGFPKGYTSCLGGVTDGNNTYLGYYFDTLQQGVADSFGEYNTEFGIEQYITQGLGVPPTTLTVPVELAQRPFYFQQWMLALIKYLNYASAPNTPIETIDAYKSDPNELFFDSVNPTFVFGNYVYRDAVNATGKAPIQVNVGVNLLTSVINNVGFVQHNFRGETALYTALRDVASDQLGFEPLYTQNMVSSPVLQSVFSVDGTTPGTTTPDYNCAINTTQSTKGDFVGCSATQVVPVDAYGNSIYAPYKDSFGTSAFTIPAYGQKPNNSGMTITPVELIQSATVQLPVYSPSYTLAGQTPSQSSSITVLLPYLTGSSVGFPVAIDGSRDKFYNTQNIDFSGATVSASVDFEYETTPGPGPNGSGGSTSTVIRAIETTSYLGSVFPCAQPSPTVGQSQDILGVRMYDEAQPILNWIAAHGNATAECGIIVEYSGYGNYPAYISFGINPGLPISGMRFELTAGFGGSVVTGLTVFDPNIVASLGQ